MSAAGLLQLHLEQGFLLLCGVLALRGAWLWAGHLRAEPQLETWRRLALGMALGALALPVLARLPPNDFEPLRSRAPVRAPADGARRYAARSALPTMPTYKLKLSAGHQTAARWTLAALLAGSALRGAAGIRRQRRLRRTLAGLPVIRRLKRVSISACDRAPVPYAAHAGGRAWVVVPTDLLDDARALRILVAHELQHHRQRDLHVLLGLEALRAFFFWHPLMPSLGRLIGELQELRCDATLVRRGRAQPRAYAELLLRAADVEGRWRFVPQGASAMSGTCRKLLRRRIVMLMNRTTDPRRSRSHVVAGLACVASLAFGSALARSAVLDRPLEPADVAVLADKLAQRGLAVPLDPVVVEEVNTWLGTAKSRTFLRAARQRLEAEHEMVAATFERHRVPDALAAVAVVESGFRNLEAREGFQGAGVWQFIPHTARQLGLKVEPGRDERLDVERETEIAARYLRMLHLQFQDWPLALAGYNAGASKVVAVSDANDTRDAWQLIRTGRLNRYAATVVAAALVLEDGDRLLGTSE